MKQRECAVLRCSERDALIPTKTLIFGLLVEVDLCHAHEAEHSAALHEKFRELYGVDFVDPSRQ